jgi:hypothetical protein
MESTEFARLIPVKHFLSVLLRALRRARHFALVEGIRVGIGDGWDTSRNKGNSLLRFLLVEAAQVTARSLPEWRSKYVHLTMRRGRKIAILHVTF